MTRRNWTRRAKQRQLARRVTASPTCYPPNTLRIRPVADWPAPRPVAGWRTQYPAEFPVTTRTEETPVNEIRAIDYNGFTPSDEPDLSWWTADRSEVHFADLSGERAA